MQDSRATLLLLALAATALAASVLGPRFGGPDPMVMMTVLFSSLIATIAGSAFTAICGGILFHQWDDHVRVLRLMIACSLANQIFIVLSLRGAISWREIARYIAGGICGVPLGSWAVLQFDKARFGQLIAGFLFVYACFIVAARPRRPQQPSPIADAVIGVAGGLLGATAALPSLPLTVWCQLRGRDPVVIRTITQPFILAVDIVALLFLSIVDPAHGVIADAPDLLCVPAACFGSYVGMGCVRGPTEQQFALAVSVLIIVCGLSFVL